jgi:hypothetical protein
VPGAKLKDALRFLDIGEDVSCAISTCGCPEISTWSLTCRFVAEPATA